jgi:uncharacterized membrane protein YjjP (DUF1212 family)
MHITNLWGVGLWLVVYLGFIVALVVVLVRESKQKRRKRHGT